MRHVLSANKMGRGRERERERERERDCTVEDCGAGRSSFAFKISIFLRCREINGLGCNLAKWQSPQVKGFIK